MKLSKILVAFLLSTLIGGCGLFDSGIEWRSGPYALLWIDTSDNVSLSYDAGSGAWVGRVEPQVFAVGSNDQFIVAKQHPIGNKKRVHYFVVLRGKDSIAADLKKVLIGPLTADEFDRKSKELNLPKFTKVLESLE